MENMRVSFKTCEFHDTVTFLKMPLQLVTGDIDVSIAFWCRRFTCLDALQELCRVQVE